MRKQILSATLVYSMLTFLQPLVNLGIQPLLLRYLSETDFARYSLLSNYATLISIFAAFNIGSAVIAYYPTYAHNPQRSRAFVGQIVGFTLRSSLLLAVVMAIAGPWLFAWQYGSNITYYPLGFIATLNGIGLAIYTPYLIQVNMTQALRKYALLTLMSVVGGTSLLLMLIVPPLSAGAWGALLGRTIGVWLPVVVLLADYNAYWFTKLDFRYLKKPMLFARYTLLNASLDWLAAVGDRFMIEHFLIMSSVAAYSLLNILIGASEMGFYALRTAILPYLYASFEQQEKENIYQASNNLYRFYMAGSMLGVSGAALLGSNIRWLTSKPAYLQLQPYSCLYAAAFAALSVTLLVYTRYYYKQNARSVLWYSLFGANCTLWANAWLLPSKGLIGAVVAMIFSRWATLALLYISSSEARKIIGHKNVLTPLILTLSILLGASYIEHYGTSFTWVRGQIGIVQFFLVFILLCFLNRKAVLIVCRAYAVRFFIK